MNLRDITSCPDCGSTNIIHSTMREQIICRDCGLIFEPLAPGIEERMPLTKPAVSKTAAKPKKAAKKPKAKKAVKKPKKAAKKPKAKKAAKKPKAKPKKKAKKKTSGFKRLLKGLRKKK